MTPPSLVVGERSLTPVTVHRRLETRGGLGTVEAPRLLTAVQVCGARSFSSSMLWLSGFIALVVGG